MRIRTPAAMAGVFFDADALNIKAIFCADRVAISVKRVYHKPVKGYIEPSDKENETEMIRIMIDASSDLHPDDPCCDFFIPIAINLDGREYLSGTELDNDGFYQLLEGADGFPRTSQPAPQTFIDVFERVRDAGDELLYFAPSSALSGTYQGACLARDLVGYEGVHIVDSKAASHMVGMLARCAAALARQGARVEEILHRCEELRGRIRLIVGVDTLEFLRRSGRLSKAMAVLGELTRMRPVISIMEDGKAEAIAKCLGKSRAMHFLLDKLREARIDPSFPLCSLYTYGVENCVRLEEKLAGLGKKVANRLQVGAAIGAHAGPSVYGVMYVEA